MYFNAVVAVVAVVVAVAVVAFVTAAAVITTATVITADVEDIHFFPLSSLGFKECVWVVAFESVLRHHRRHQRK